MPPAQSFVFVIRVDGAKLFWTGRHRMDGKLHRSEHRADAIKFPSKAVALAVAETHDELRDSEQWKIAPLTAGAVPK